VRALIEQRREAVAAGRAVAKQRIDAIQARHKKMGFLLPGDGPARAEASKSIREADAIFKELDDLDAKAKAAESDAESPL